MTTRLLQFNLPIEPLPKGRPRFSAGRVYTPPKTLRYERELRILIQQKVGSDHRPFMGPVSVQLAFFCPRPQKAAPLSWKPTRPDLDNLAKAVMDAANGLLWVDDNQIVSMNAKKLHCSDRPSVTIQVEELP